LKGNCRFGHKCEWATGESGYERERGFADPVACDRLLPLVAAVTGALAHLYPNEPPTMDRKHKKAAQLAANGATQEEIEAVVYGGASYILPSGGYAQDHEDDAGGEGDQQQGQHDGGVAIPREAKSGTTPGGKMSYSQSLKSPPSVRSGKATAGDGSSSASHLDAIMAGGGARNRRESSSQDRTGAVAIKSVRAQAQREEAAISIGSISPANRHQAALLSTLNRPGSGGQAGASHSPSSTAQTFVYAPGASSSGSVPRSGMTPRGPGDESENFKSRPVPLSVPGPLPMSARSGSFVQDPIGTPPRESGSFMLGRSLSGVGPYTAPGVRGSFSSTADASTMRPGLKTTGFSDPNVNMPPGSLTGPKFSSSVMGAEFGQMGRDIWGQRTSLAPPVTRTHSTQSGMSRPILDLTSRRESEVFMLDDADGDDVDAAEEFLPGSLTELLNPREKARRLSRRESGSAPGVGSGSVGIRAGWVSSSGDAPALGGIGSAGSSWDSRPNMEALLNRQALSAGAVDGGFLRSLWDDAGEDARRRARQNSDMPPASASAAVGGLSSMFAGSQGGGSSINNKSSDGSLTAPADTDFQLGPSNASVAFLPTFTAHRQAALGDHGSPATRGNLHSPSRPSPLHRDTTTQAISSSRVPVEDGMEVQHTHLAPQHLRPLVSPGTRALETHAPGQSLPQGLAAGLSRLHLRPSPSRNTSGLTIGLAGGEALSPNASSIGQNIGPQTIGRYETLARQDASERPQVPQIHTPAGEGEDDDLFEMEG